MAGEKGRFFSLSLSLFPSFLLFRNEETEKKKKEAKKKEEGGTDDEDVGGGKEDEDEEEVEGKKKKNSLVCVTADRWANGRVKSNRWWNRRRRRSEGGTRWGIRFTRYFLEKKIYSAS